jgi:DNA end-binding protein Ku
MVPHVLSRLWDSLVRKKTATSPPDMASTIWKGQLTFGLVAFPVRLQKAARRERIALKYVRETRYDDASDESEPAAAEEEPRESNKRSPAGAPQPSDASEVRSELLPVRQGYFSEGQLEPSSTAELQRGYEVAPDKFVVVRPEELKRLRKATSPDMQILRSVKMQEIDPVFLETSYYVIPGLGGEKSYALFYRALAETKLAALAQVAMHGREHVIVLRAGAKGLIAHTMFYVNEVRGGDEYATETAGVIGKELELAKKYIEALMEPFKPEEFTDGYREQLQALIASKEVPQPVAETGEPKKATGHVVDIMDALRKSLETAKAANRQRKPAASEVATDRKPRKRKA